MNSAIKSKPLNKFNQMPQLRNTPQMNSAITLPNDNLIFPNNPSSSISSSSDVTSPSSITTPENTALPEDTISSEDTTVPEGTTILVGAQFNKDGSRKIFSKTFTKDINELCISLNDIENNGSEYDFKFPDKIQEAKKDLATKINNELKFTPSDSLNPFIPLPQSNNKGFNLSNLNPFSKKGGKTNNKRIKKIRNKKRRTMKNKSKTI